MSVGVGEEEVDCDVGREIAFGAGGAGLESSGISDGKSS
jgi:hypothetical protein